MIWSCNVAGIRQRDHRGRWALILVSLVGLGLVWTTPTEGLAAEGARRFIGVPLEGDPLQPYRELLRSQIANQVPTLSTSTSFVYEFNPETDVYERSAVTFGPLFADRAVSIGKGRFDVNVSYSYIDFAQYDGDDLDHIRTRVEVAKIGDVSAFAGLGAEVKIPTEVVVDLDIEVQLIDFSFTYGVFQDVDVNVDIPLLRTFTRTKGTFRVPDPRAEIQLPPGRSPVTVDATARDSEFGIGDVRLRGKYVAARHPVECAGLLDLVLPTAPASDPEDIRGTGDTRLGVYFIVSRTFRGILEPHAHAGVEFNASDVDTSQAKYAVGATAQVTSFAAFSVDFLGRSEFAPLTRVPPAGRLPAVADGQFLEVAPPFHGRPFLADVKRNDILDLAVGLKLALRPSAVFFAAATLPLNDDGLRANVVPTVGFEVAF